ncbi:hypothetical protein ACLOJK_026932 [Asimina triloba]
MSEKHTIFTAIGKTKKKSFPFAEPVSRLLEFLERRKSIVSIRERVVRAGLPPCLPATPPNRIKRRKPVCFTLMEPTFQLDRPPLEGGIA